MSGVEAISMACNVMTVISFSLETIKLYRSIYEAGSSDPELAKKAEHIRETSGEVERLLHEQQQLDPAQRAMTSDTEKRLQGIADKCLQYSKDIEQEIASTSPKKSGIPRALKSTVKTMWRKPHLDQLKANLQTTQSTMDTAVNVQILEQCIASGNLSHEIYNRLDLGEQKFIASYEQRSLAIEDLLKQLHGHITEEHITTRGHNTKEHITTREAVTKSINVMKINDRQEQACENLLNSLDYKLMNERKNAIPKKHDDTFEWVFEGLKSNKHSTPDFKPHSDSDSETSNDRNDPEYWPRRMRRLNVTKAKRNQGKADLLGWLRGDRSGAFWISGKPGSGKSTFLKFIMSDDRTKLSLSEWRSQPEIITHFFWKPGTFLQQNFQGLLCSLLYQVLSIDVDVCAQLLRKTPGLRRKRDVTDWDLEELKRHLLMALRANNRSYLVLLDGLDEMAKPHRGLKELFDFLDVLMKERRVKLCLSSRPERIFLARFSSYQHLRMHDVNFADICDFTMEFLNGLDPKPHDRIRRLIACEILEKADGVFIWVHLALQNVRNGIEELDEDWDDIYQRILELPSDLMKLYKDMWSRLDQTKENYVEMAALYFQITKVFFETARIHPYLEMQSDFYGYPTVTSLAVASDNAILESFTGQDKLPTPMELVKRCNHVHKTLSSICGGMLESKTPFSDLFPNQSKIGDHDDQSDFSLLQENGVSDACFAIQKWESGAADVRFTHRTVIDFLDSAEGRKLFGKYATTSETIHSRIANAAIILGCVPYDHFDPLNKIRIILILLARFSLSSDRVHDLFCRVHRHAHMIIGDSNAPSSFSSHDYFIYIASYEMYHESVARFLSGLEGDTCVTTAAAALVGAIECHQAHANDEHESERYRLMQMCIDCHRPGQIMSEVSDLDDSSHFFIAWRSFLLRNLGHANAGELRREEDILEVIESFISAGVLQRQPPPRYLVMIVMIGGDTADVVIPSQRHITEHGRMYGSYHEFDPLFESNLLFEVDDTFILHQLCNRISKPSEYIISVLQAMGHSIVRPILAWNSGEPSDFFTCTLKNQEDEKDFVDWAFKGFPLEEEEELPKGAPDYLELVHRGPYEDYFEALENVGYPLPDINRKHVSWNLY